jgi:hypothetical protein
MAESRSASISRFDQGSVASLASRCGAMSRNGPDKKLDTVIDLLAIPSTVVPCRARATAVCRGPV